MNKGKLLIFVWGFEEVSLSVGDDDINKTKMSLSSATIAALGEEQSTAERAIKRAAWVPT